MNDKIQLNNIKVTSVCLVKGNYEGYDYYKLVAETDKGIQLAKKLTEFEYNTLKGTNEQTKRII